MYSLFWHYLLISCSTIRLILLPVLVIIDGVEIIIGYIELLQSITTSNYSAIANSHTLQFTTARTKSSQSAVSSLVVA
jgi:hypothetical protein